MESRPWLKNYPSGVPANIDPSQYETLVDFIEECMTKFSGQVAFENFGKTMTFKELDTRSKNFGAYLQSRGLRAGDKVALMMPNLLQYPIAIIGALRAGIIVVNTNPLYTSREMLHQFSDSEVKGIVIAENFANNLEEILSDTCIDVIIRTSIGEMVGGLKGRMINFVLKYIKRLIPKNNLPNTVSFKEALAQGKKFEIKKPENGPDSVIMLQYTGGTTGVSKGAMLTNKNLISNMLQSTAILNVNLVESKEVVLSPLPMYHIFAFAVNCLGMMRIGAHTILVTNPRDINSIVKEFKSHKITSMSGVNTLFNAMMLNKNFQALDFSSFKVAVAGGMAMQTAVAEKWQELTGTRISEGYGMTEASPVVTMNPLDETAKIGTIGIPIPSTDVRIVAEDGTVQGVGGVGEVQVRGPQVMKGYWNKPEDTARTFDGEWLLTGDIGVMDEDGFFKIVDRKKDMIIVSGFNVYPNEIEDVVALHPKVLEVAAIGIPHEKSGECVKLFVVKKDKTLKEDELIQHCRKNLTGYKIPRSVEFIADLPKSNVGKILRRKLRDGESA